MNRAILKLGLSSLVVVSIFTGCSLGNPPQPYVKKVDNKFLDPDKKQKFLNDVIQSLVKESEYLSSNGCISYYYIGELSSHTLRNCFIIKNDKIIREDKSTYKWRTKPFNVGPENYIPRPSKKYAEFINQLQSSGLIENKYNNLLNQQ